MGLKKYFLYGILLGALATFSLSLFPSKANGLEKLVNEPVIKTLDNKESIEKKSSSSIIMNTILNGYSIGVSLNKNNHINTNSPGTRDYFPVSSPTSRNRVELRGECAKSLLKNRDRERKLFNLNYHLYKKEFSADFAHSFDRKFNRNSTYFVGGWKKKYKNLEISLGGGFKRGNVGPIKDKKKIIGNFSLYYNRSNKDYELKTNFRTFVSNQYINRNNYKRVYYSEGGFSLSAKKGFKNIRPLLTGYFRRDYKKYNFYNISVGGSF